MKKLMVSMCALLLLVGLQVSPVRAQDKPDHEALVKQTLEALKGIGDTLATIKDKATSDAAIPKLEQAAKTMEDLQQKFKDAGEPTKEVKDRLEKMYKADLEKAAKRLTEEAARLASVDGGKAALDVFAKLKKPE